MKFKPNAVEQTHNLMNNALFGKSRASVESHMELHVTADTDIAITQVKTTCQWRATLKKRIIYGTT